MSYDQTAADVSGAHANQWGSIYRAFTRIDKGLTPALFTLDATNPMADTVNVGGRFRNDHDNEFSITSGYAKSLPEAIDLLTDNATCRRLEAIELLPAMNEFCKYEFSSEFVYLCLEATNQCEVVWRVLRLPRYYWTRHAPLPCSPLAVQQPPQSLLVALAALSLEQVTHNFEGRNSAVLSEFGLLAGARDRVAVANVKLIGLDQDRLGHLTANLDQLSLSTYEGREAGGSLIVAAPNAVSCMLRFCAPVEIRDYRASRKVLESSSPDFPILTDGMVLHGFIARAQLEASAIQFAEIQYIGRHCWRYVFEGRTLFEVRDGVPGLGQQQCIYERFRMALLGWSNLNENAMNRLWKVVELLSRSGHGAGVIVSVEAEFEADRLGNEGVRTEVTEFQPEMAGQLASVDGAILLDTEARIHAFGIILDGPACLGGSGSRGSRYNCSLRYVRNRDSKAFAIVVSSDGTVDAIDAVDIHRI